MRYQIDVERVQRGGLQLAIVGIGLMLEKDLAPIDARVRDDGINTPILVPTQLVDADQIVPDCNIGLAGDYIADGVLASQCTTFLRQGDRTRVDLDSPPDSVVEIHSSRPGPSSPHALARRSVNKDEYR
jgi:hypothetical protein